MSTLKPPLPPPPSSSSFEPKKNSYSRKNINTWNDIHEFRAYSSSYSYRNQFINQKKSIRARVATFMHIKFDKHIQMRSSTYHIIYATKARKKNSHRFHLTVCSQPAPIFFFSQNTTSFHEIPFFSSSFLPCHAFQHIHLKYTYVYTLIMHTSNVRVYERMENGRKMGDVHPLVHHK